MVKIKTMYKNYGAMGFRDWWQLDCTNRIQTMIVGSRFHSLIGIETRIRPASVSL